MVGTVLAVQRSNKDVQQQQQQQKKISWTQQDLTESQMTVLIILDLSPEPGLVSHELESLSPSQVTL